jgi:hypothetical protein
MTGTLTAASRAKTCRIFKIWQVYGIASVKVGVGWQEEVGR